MKLEPQKQQPQEGHIVSNTSKPSDDGMLRKVQIICGVLAVVLVIFSIRFVGSVREYQTTLADQKAEIATLQDTLKELKDANDAADVKAEEAAKEDRSLRDNKLAGDFAKKLLTWDSYDTYTGVRTWLQESYQVAADDSLLTSFLPDLPKETVENFNMKFEGATSYEVKTDGDVRSYFALCEVSNKIDGNTGKGHVGLFYTIDKDGKFSNLSAYTLVH